jgi:hypothetical protein
MWHDVTPWERRRAICEAERYPLFRTTDPVTSRLAAAQAVGVQADHFRRILGALGRGPAGQTLIADRADLEKHAVGKRLSEMERRGLIEQTGRKILNSVGRKEREWRTA